MAEPEDALDTLKERLSALREGQSWARFARGIHVAPQTLTDLLKAKPGEYQDAPPKKAAGRAETLSRIVRFVNLDSNHPINLTAVLNALGLESAGLSPSAGLDRLVTSGMQDEDVEFRTHGDVVLRRIERRKLGGDPKPIKAGIDKWAPFWAPDESLDNSFAGVFMRRLLGCLNPLEWGNPHLKPLEFSEASDANCVRVGKYDALFSVYDVPSRRLSGFEFIRLPGLRGALGAIAFGIDHTVTWESILGDELAAHQLNAFVIEGEVGDFFLSGSCDYRPSQIKRLARSISASKIAEDLWNRSRPRSGEGHKVRPFLFCADSSITAKVADELTGIFRSNATGATADEFENMLKLVAPDPVFSPYFPLGIAVNGRGTRWIDLLRDALQTELFSNGGALTAKHYVQLLARSDAKSMEVVSLVPDLPLEIAQRFAEHIKWAVDRFDGELSEERKEKLRAWPGIPGPKTSRIRNGSATRTFSCTLADGVTAEVTVRLIEGVGEKIPKGATASGAASKRNSTVPTTRDKAIKRPVAKKQGDAK